MTEILVVDDDKDIIKLIAHSIEKAFPSLGVQVAENGIQALELLQKHNISLIITDLKMPEMDGFELLAQVMEHYPDISVIVTTGHTIAAERKVALAENTLEVMFKPLAMHHLRQTVKRCLEKQAEGGRLNNVSPAVFMQLVDMEQKTCTIRIQQQATGRMGVLFFSKGKLLNARVQNLQGEAAALEIFSWDHISLTIENDCCLEKAKIRRSLNSLILEASHIKDEREAEDNAAGPASRQAGESRESQAKREIAAILKRLHNIPELNGQIKSVVLDPKWNSLVSAMVQLGSMVQSGKLKAVGIKTGSGPGCIVIPTRPAAALSLAAGCSREIIYQLLA